MDQVTGSGFWHTKRGGRSLLCALELRVSVFMSLSAVFCGQAAEVPLEYRVKAAYLLNFTKFIGWPSEAFEAPDSPIGICILGDDPFGSTLDRIVQREIVNGRQVIVQRIKRVPEPKTCQVVFVSKPGKDESQTGYGPGVLTVGEGESFLREGGMIAFVLDNRHVRFKVNQASAESAGLKLSSQLLKVAKAVEE